MTYKIKLKKVNEDYKDTENGKEYVRLKKVIKKAEEEKQKIMKGTSKLSNQDCLLNSIKLQQARLKRNDLLQKRLESLK